MNRRSIKLLRQIDGLNQHEFAKLIGVSRSTIAYIEAGYISVSPKITQKITETLGQDRIKSMELLLNRIKETG